jgi:magnesium transporter
MLISCATYQDEHMPELKWRYGYAISLLFMGTIDVYLYFRFKKAKWL